ncbi:MAG: Bug family tripartite tricarboxylate transporter substrate binding protein, partial [Angustibacter sp.]
MQHGKSRQSSPPARARMISRWAAPLTAVLMLSACGATAADNQAGTSVQDLRMMVPNSSGSGYDVTARSVVRVLEDSKITKGTEVFNVTGAGGTVGLAKLINDTNKDDLAMLMGLGLVGASYTNKSSPRLTGTTPIARLIEEQSAVLVSKNSPYRSLEGLLTAWKADPKKISVGGGSVPGGPDHLLPMQMAATVGIDVDQVNYVSYDGGGELLPALLGNKVAFATSGAGEYLAQIQSGEVRVLATSGARRSE